MSRDLERAIEVLDLFCATAAERPQRKRVRRRLDLALATLERWLALEVANARGRPRRLLRELTVQLQVARIRFYVFETEPVRSELATAALVSAFKDLSHILERLREAGERKPPSGSNDQPEGP